MQKHRVPGAAIAIVENGSLVASAGIGEKQEGTEDPVDPATLFRVASLSKMVTGATALKLQEEGALDLSKPVTQYVPLVLASGFDPSTVSVSEILDHTSGIPDFDVDQSCLLGPDARTAFFANGPSQPLWTPPGVVWNYSNQGFAVAGWIIDHAAAESFEDAVQTRVFEPAGMTTATFDPAQAMIGDYATGHVHPSGQPTTFLPPDAHDCAATRPAAGVIASVLDYAHFAETILAGGGAMLTSDSTALMTSIHADTDHQPGGAEGYGYGITVRNDWKGLNVLRHTGSDPGYRSSIWMVPSQKFAAVIFYNLGTHSPDSMVAAAVDAYLGTADIEVPAATTPPTAWTPYQGNYLDPFVLGQVTVTNDGTALHVALPGLGVSDVVLAQNAGDAFDATLEENGEEFEESDGITFYPGPLGPATYLVTRKGVAIHRE